jgi:hypothetical protein
MGQLFRVGHDSTVLASVLFGVFRPLYQNVASQRFGCLRSVTGWRFLLSLPTRGASTTFWLDKINSVELRLLPQGCLYRRRSVLAVFRPTACSSCEPISPGGRLWKVHDVRVPLRDTTNEQTTTATHELSSRCFALLFCFQGQMSLVASELGKGIVECTFNHTLGH